VRLTGRLRIFHLEKVVVVSSLWLLIAVGLKAPFRRPFSAILGIATWRGECSCVTVGIIEDPSFTSPIYLQPLRSKTSVGVVKRMQRVRRKEGRKEERKMSSAEAGHYLLQG